MFKIYKAQKHAYLVPTCYMIVVKVYWQQVLHTPSVSTSRPLSLERPLEGLRDVPQLCHHGGQRDVVARGHIPLRVDGQDEEVSQGGVGGQGGEQGEGRLVQLHVLGYVQDCRKRYY